MKLYSSKLNLTLNVIGDKKKKLSTNQGREKETVKKSEKKRGNCQPIRETKEKLSTNQGRDEETINQSGTRRGSNLSIKEAKEQLSTNQKREEEHVTQSEGQREIKLRRENCRPMKVEERTLCFTKFKNLNDVSAVIVNNLLTLYSKIEKEK